MNSEISKWETNLAALSLRQPNLAQRLVDVPFPRGLEILDLGQGRFSAVKRGVSLHSRKDPEAEARAFVQSPQVIEALGKSRRIAVFGLGLGWHVQALASFCERVAVVEPDPGMIKAALTVLDWSRWGDRVTFWTGDDPWPFIEEPGWASVIHPPTRRLHPETFARFEAGLSDRGRRVAGRSGPWTILLAGPIYGGSVPVFSHVHQSLKDLGHRVVAADMTPLEHFFGPLRQMPLASGFGDEAMNRLLAFSESYVLALTEEHQPDLFLALAQAPLTPKALSRIRSRGVTTAFWFIEDFRLMRYFREVAPAYDFFFHIQGKDLEKELTGLGVSRSFHLPLAADPERFRPLENEGDLAPFLADLSFMGAGYPNRQAVLSQLLDFDLKIWGTGWDRSGPLGRTVQCEGKRVGWEETVLIFNGGRINLNLHSSVFSSGLDPKGGFLNPRTFEVAACGGFQLVDDRPGLADCFAPGREIGVFSSIQDLREKIVYYLARPDLRREIGFRARARVLAEHTYRHRMSALLDIIAQN